MRVLLTTLVALIPVLAVPAADNWPQFRGPDGNGMSDATGLPVTWSERENIRWKVAIHDKGWSSPVVWGNQVWLTTAREDGKELFVICVDRRNGKILHDFKLYDIEKPLFCPPFNSHASPTPVLEEGRAYIHFGSYGTCCLDSATAKVLWERRDLPCDHWRAPGSSPIIVGNLIYLTFDGYDKQYVVALDKTNGKTVWQKDRNINYGTDNGDLKKAYSTPSVFVIDGKPQLISPAAAATVAYNPATGDEIWRVYHGGMNEALRPLRGHGLIYLSSGHTQTLLAVREGLTGDITKEGIAWKSGRGAPSRPSPLLIGDNLFMISDQGIGACLDAKTGKQIWQERVGKETSSSPVSAEGRIYTADQEGGTHVFAAERQFKLIATNKLDAGCMASPAIAGDAIFLRTKTHLYCIGK